jgi:nitrogenase subunit NifH
LITTPDISDPLYYLEQSNLIKFSNKSDALTALNDDAVVKLTAEGIRFVENGGNPEMGIDL